MLRERSAIQAMVLSREENPVVMARSKKLKLEVVQAALKKDQALLKLIAERAITPSEIIFLGNDITDLAVLPLVSFFAAPADAHPDVRRKADLVLEHTGGHGAIRELCDIILAHLKNGQND